MNGNQFLILGDWGPRGETPVELGQRMLRSIEALREINPEFGPWWLIDFVEEDGIPFERARLHMTEIVANGEDLDDDDEPMPGAGYAVSASSRDEDDPMSVGLKVNGGDSRAYWRYPNNLAFETGYDEYPDPSIVTYSAFKAVTLLLVATWQPALARICSRELMGFWKQETKYFDLCWMSYLSAPLAARITPPPSIVTERTADGGLLLIAAEETFDVDNIEHMKNAMAIRDALAPLEAMPEKLGHW